MSVACARRVVVIVLVKFRAVCDDSDGPVTKAEGGGIGFRLGGVAGSGTAGMVLERGRKLEGLLGPACG